MGSLALTEADERRRTGTPLSGLLLIAARRDAVVRETDCAAGSGGVDLPSGKALDVPAQMSELVAASTINRKTLRRGIEP